MAKTRISEYSTTNSSNTDINSINIDEGCAPSGINNAIREVMVHLKNWQTNASGDGATFANLVVQGTGSFTGAVTMSAGATLSGTNTLSGSNIISGNINSSGSNTFSGTQIISGNINSSGTNTFSGTTVMSGANSLALAAGSASAPSLLANGDTNTGVWFPAADTIAASTGGSERVRIDSSGNVGIGTSSPTDKLHVAGTTKTTGNTTLVSDGTAAYLNVGDASPPAGVNTAQHIFNGYGVLAGQKVNNGEFDIGYNFYYQSGFKSRVDGIAYRLSMGEVSGQIDLQIAPAPGGAGSALTFTKVLLAQKDKSIALQGTIPQTGTGITFPATQSASSDANTLDDYEQGTWTPSVGGNATYTTQSGRYTKIGRMVYVQGAIQINAIGTGSTTAISGLPFATANQTDVESGIAVSYFADSSTNIVSLYAFANSSTISLRSLTAAGATLATNAIFKNATAVEFGGWYQAAD